MRRRAELLLWRGVYYNVDEIDTSAITGLRAITALQIACGHWLLFYGNSDSPYLDFQGGVAVSIFFLITGFVMYIAYHEKVEKQGFKYWEFIKRRYIRVLPLHWFALAWFAPFLAFNYRTIVADYNFWQNKSGEVNLIMGIVLDTIIDAILDIFSMLLELCVLESELSTGVLLLLSVADAQAQRVGAQIRGESGDRLSHRGRSRK